MKNGSQTSIPLAYYSQWRDVTREEWQHRACGIAVLASMLSHLDGGRERMNLDRLIDEAVAMGAHDPAIGWIHSGLIALAAKHGAILESRVYRIHGNTRQESVEMARGISEIVHELRSGVPVIASVRRGFLEGGSPHMVLLSGIDDASGHTVFLVHDPDASTEEDGAYRRVSSDVFQKNWRKLAIFSGSR